MMGVNEARRAAAEEAASDYYFEQLIEKKIREHFKCFVIVNIFPGLDIVMTEAGIFKYDIGEDGLEIYVMEPEEEPCATIEI